MLHHEKLLSGDVSFKWQRDSTAFTAVREEFLVHPVGAVKNYCSLNDDFINIFNNDIMKEIFIETNRYAHRVINKTKAVGEDNKNNNEESNDDSDERAKAGRSKARRRGPKRRHKGKKQMSYSPATSGTAPNPKIMSKALTGRTIQIVLNLLEGLEHKGHCVTVGNFYNGPALARYFKCRGFDYLGTVRLTRKNIPEDVKRMKKNCEKGMITARHSGNGDVGGNGGVGVERCENRIDD
ncbi:PiggyBac transposable element-derived protein 4 [Eumeta japonica]|uniref:PiggyBac transposable element-derived protein 4 n=1 Tax=Eumeta variegata TaxID=151549 RepID=A0A4C1VAF7_EUMVA|nr:PiggyBac transposable element-derived protein 4 [Eumeta japonica]